ncbi:P-loop containing nucleoside triphosphate hydrolase protein [Colletotrichum godetiae]|uniref:P-loop containing nucleoside triphosphate hydrolase protein n=1 Tax=Colletotrichum godetiae TaxID=1209918 RepID=A0AAJ0EXU6_9PEZI|nr:P-loop containing nucleoside triphosphate hydrolase protein [Colletotrichum godetiae]KAK1675565.1 P-loop containing nucleoside triphosphate hydrolase protein [Colletotrichum godetiae]
MPSMTREVRDGVIFTPAYAWNSLTREERQEASEDLGTLVSFMDEYILPLGKAIEAEGASDVRVHYQELWHVFKPGSIVYVKDPAVPQKLWRVVQACIRLGSGSLETQGHSLTRMGEDKEAWDYLQIDDGHRTIIKSLMATHFRKNKSERRQFDIIQDKGKGLIVLLHGVPGVGKTSTAETVAAYYNKPLLPITCGDLGMTPTEVESNLQAAFQMAQAWECVLLFDEADVFLAERIQDNIERNALVSVFLRVMEYYEGILFLTTNKVGSFDEAFKSRMSMALYYSPLTHEQTKKIWEVQMDRSEELSVAAAPENESQHVKFNRDEIKALSTTLWNLQTMRDDHKPVWNGRQIRNAFQTAVALAEFHQQGNHIPGPIIVKGEHFGVPVVFHNPQQFGMMGMGSMQNMGMAGPGFNNLQNQGNPIASQSSQAGFGMGNIGVSNNNTGNAGLGSSGMSGSNTALGAQHSNSNSAGIPGQNQAAQLSPQQQQRFQEFLRFQQQQQQ